MEMIFVNFIPFGSDWWLLLVFTNQILFSVL